MREPTIGSAPSPHHTGRSPRRVVEAVRVVANEVVKGAQAFWAERTPILLGMATFGALYLGMMLIIGQGRLPRDLLPLTLVGMAAYAALWIGSLQLVADQLEQMRAGTLEQTHLSPVPPAVLVTGRLLSTAVQGIVTAAGLVLAVVVVVGVALPWRWAAAVPAALTLVQVLAFSLLFAGVTLVVPFVGEVHHAAVSLVAFFNGAFLPVDQLPGGLRTVARLLPTTLGVEATVDVLHRGADLAGLLRDGTLTALSVYTALLTAVALVVYEISHRRARRRGVLGRH